MFEMGPPGTLFHPGKDQCYESLIMDHPVLKDIGLAQTVGEVAVKEAGQVAPLVHRLLRPHLQDTTMVEDV